MGNPERFSTQVEDIKKEQKDLAQRRDVLKKLDLFVLDNSLRETTVGQLRGHSIDNKWKIYEQVKKCGFENIIVASFNHMTRMGDIFITQLRERGEDMNKFWAFTELIETYKNRIPQDDLPIGLEKMKDLGINHVIIEFDLVYHGIDYKQFGAKKICKLLHKRIDWIRSNLSRDSKIAVNFRDLSDCMFKKPARVFKVVNYLSTMENPIFAIAYEESGKYFSEEVAAWTAAVRKEMNRCGFTQGHLLCHVHQQWGLHESTQLACLANGATGIWAGLCEEGAAMGHACSAISMLNLVRMGNKEIQNKYNCTELRKAAIAVTEITTGLLPHPKQIIYGARALDIVFGLDQFKPNKKEFSLAEFLGEEPVMRISTLASAGMIVLRLQRMFGEDDQFIEEMGVKMKETMLEDLSNNVKEEYHSATGLAMLFDRSGGKLTAKMSEALAEVDVKSEQKQILLNEVRAMWDQWDLRDGKKDDMLSFDAFYNGFMSPYFGCYRCDETKRALAAIDMDSDGLVDWNEFCVYLKWALNQYPGITDSEELLRTAFCKGLVPAMQDAALKTMVEEDDQDEEDDTFFS